MWFPHNGKPHQIRVDHEKLMKYIVTDLQGSIEPVEFTNKIIRNYLPKSFLGSFNGQRSPFPDNVIESQIEMFSQTDASKCVDVVDKIVYNSIFWTLYFYISMSKDGVGTGCILISMQGEKPMLAYRLEFQCTNNNAEYEALIQALYKWIGLNVKYLQVYADSEVAVK